MRQEKGRSSPVAVDGRPNNLFVPRRGDVSVSIEAGDDTEKGLSFTVAVVGRPNNLLVVRRRGDVSFSVE